MEKINLFLLPFAGGSKYSYRNYQERAPSLLNIIALEYPGRGNRADESLITDIKALIDDLYYQIKPAIERGADYAIFGHSMGGLLAYLLTRKVLLQNHIAPLHLFITGTVGPSARVRSSHKRHLLSKAAFMEEIRKLNGCPDEMLRNDELFEYFEPILRADFTATENYVYEQEPPLNIPVTVITGTEERLKPADILSWQKETSQPVDFGTMPGNHFFIFHQTDAILGIITKKLAAHFKNCQV